MRVAASYLYVYCDETLNDYLAALAADRLGHLAAPGEPNVAAVLRTSIDRLARDDPALAEKWRWLAVFPAPFDRAAVAAVWGVEEEEQGIHALLLHSLVSFSRDKQMYSLHDLLRELAATEALPDEVRYRHAQHYLAVGANANSQYMRGGKDILAGLRAFDAAWPHLKAAWMWLKERADGPRARRWLSDFPGYVAYPLSLRLTPRAYIIILETALVAACALGERLRESAYLGTLGICYADLGEPRRAIMFYEQQLIITREISNRRGEGSTLGNLGLAYADLGEPHRAIEYYERQLAITREIGDRRGEGNALGNLGVAYKNLGEPRRAIECYEQRLVIAREIGDRRAEGNALGNLGIAHADLGEPRRAIEYNEQVLTIMREIGDRRGEGNALGNLGLAYAALGEPRRAIEYYEQQLVIARAISDRRGEANALANMGIAYKTLGELSRVSPLWKESLSIFDAIESPHAAQVRAWLAELDD